MAICDLVLEVEVERRGDLEPAAERLPAPYLSTSCWRSQEVK
jgi:hypothetical protein